MKTLPLAMATPFLFLVVVIWTCGEAPREEQKGIQLLEELGCCNGHEEVVVAPDGHKLTVVRMCVIFSQDGKYYANSWKGKVRGPFSNKERAQKAGSRMCPHCK